MPGILGLISRKPPEIARRELLQMLATMCHEEFYATGTWEERALGVYVGWVARKGSFADGMPLRNERGDVVLAFAGEEFPDPGIRGELRERGHDFALDDASYLVHWSEDDRNFPAGLNGKFHGLLADRRQGTAMLFNDRYGMERLYYHEAKDTFYFAAEAKAILAVRPELRTLDARGLGEFISCGAVLENRTLFHRIATLPPASVWTFRNGSLERKAGYFHPKEWEQQETLDAESFYTELREAFSRTLPRYFDGPQRVAMSLTGGLDTRMIMAWQKADPGALPCYTFGSMFRENHDVRVARRVAEACGQPFQTITAGQEFLARFPHYAERAVRLADGCVDVSRSPDLYLNEKAREIAPVRVTGDFGGEVLRGVCTFKSGESQPGLFSREVLASVQQAEETFADLRDIHPVSFAVFKQAPWDYRGVVSLEQTQVSIRTPFFDANLLSVLYRAPASALSENKASLCLISDGNKDLLRFATDRGITGNGVGFFNAVYRSFLEFQFKAEYAYDMGMPQWVAGIDHSFSALHLERLFLGRHKVFHFRVWYRDALSGYVQEILLDSQSLSRPYIERKRLEEIVRAHSKGDRNYTAEIHKLLTLELIHRALLNLN